MSDDLVTRARSTTLYESSGEESDIAEALADRIEALEAENARLREGQVSVKPLEWRETQTARGDGSHEHDGGYEAVTSIGLYVIEMYFGSDSYGWVVRLNPCGKVANCDDPDIAKAAAQADYEARILAALAHSPEGGER